MNLSSPPAQTGIPAADRAEALTAYYANPDVRRRIVEFLGGDTPENATCRYIAADSPTVSHRHPQPASELWNCLDRNLDISRALWDRESLIAHLDVEYVDAGIGRNRFSRRPRARAGRRSGYGGNDGERVPRTLLPARDRAVSCDGQTVIIERIGARAVSLRTYVYSQTAASCFRVSLA